MWNIISLKVAQIAPTYSSLLGKVLSHGSQNLWQENGWLSFSHPFFWGLKRSRDPWGSDYPVMTHPSYFLCIDWTISVQKVQYFFQFAKDYNLLDTIFQSWKLEGLLHFFWTKTIHCDLLGWSYGSNPNVLLSRMCQFDFSRFRR